MSAPSMKSPAAPARVATCGACSDGRCTMPDSCQGMAEPERLTECVCGHPPAMHNADGRCEHVAEFVGPTARCRCVEYWPADLSAPEPFPCDSWNRYIPEPF